MWVASRVSRRNADIISSIGRSARSQWQGALPSSSGFLAAIAEGSHPIPSRTRKLSPPAPMVLQGRLCGRVGRCQIYGPVPREGDRPFFCWANPRGGRKRFGVRPRHHSAVPAYERRRIRPAGSVVLLPRRRKPGGATWGRRARRRGSGERGDGLHGSRRETDSVHPSGLVPRTPPRTRHRQIPLPLRSAETSVPRVGGFDRLRVRPRLPIRGPSRSFVESRGGDLEPDHLRSERSTVATARLLAFDAVEV